MVEKQNIQRMCFDCLSKGKDECPMREIHPLARACHKFVNAKEMITKWVSKKIGEDLYIILERERDTFSTIEYWREE